MEKTRPNDPRLVSLVENAENADLIAACTGLKFGDSVMGYEYFSQMNQRSQAGKEIGRKYKKAYERIVNDIAKAIVESKK